MEPATATAVRDDLLDLVAQAADLAKRGIGFAIIPPADLWPAPVAPELEPTEIDCAIPCLGCMHDKAIAIRRRLGGLWLQLAVGRPPRLLPREFLLAGCCRNITVVQKRPLFT